MIEYDPELDVILSDLSGDGQQREDDENSTQADEDFDYWEGQIEDSFHERDMD